jgi:hypothetical protein
MYRDRPLRGQRNQFPKLDASGAAKLRYPAPQRLKNSSAVGARN